jgi:hypothetical protein
MMAKEAIIHWNAFFWWIRFMAASRAFDSVVMTTG